MICVGCRRQIPAKDKSKAVMRAGTIVACSACKRPIAEAPAPYALTKTDRTFLKSLRIEA